MILCKAVVAVPSDSAKSYFTPAHHISNSKFAHVLEKLTRSSSGVFQEFLDLIQFMDTIIRSENSIYMWSLKRSLHRIPCQIMTLIRCEQRHLCIFSFTQQTFWVEA